MDQTERNCLNQAKLRVYKINKNYERTFFGAIPNKFFTAHSLFC